MRTAEILLRPSAKQVRTAYGYGSKERGQLIILRPNIDHSTCSSTCQAITVPTTPPLQALLGILDGILINYIAPARGSRA